MTETREQETNQQRAAYETPTVQIYGDIREFTMANLDGVGSYDNNPPRARRYKTQPF
jgi:hypothetical protein